MAKQNKQGLTAEQLSAKYPGSFPFPDMPKNASDELRAEINLVRNTSKRNAQAEVSAFALPVLKALETEPEMLLDAEQVLTPRLKEAVAFLSVKRERGVKSDGKRGTRTPDSVLVADFFKDPANHLTLGSPTPNQVGTAELFIKLDMDSLRVRSALKRHLETAKPEDRVWVSYDTEDRVYKVWGTGADAPEGWTGYVPAPTGPAALDNATK